MHELNKHYELLLEMRPEYLYASIKADTIDQPTVVAYLHEVIAKCKKLGRTRLLIERDIPAALSETEVFFSGTDFAHTGLADMMVAIVDHRPENAEGLELTILVQNNRGANSRLFDNTADAEAWLQKSLPHLAHIDTI